MGNHSMVGGDEIVKARRRLHACDQRKGASIVHQDGITYRWCHRHNSFCLAPPNKEIR